MSEKRSRASENDPGTPPARNLGAGNARCGAHDGDNDRDPLTRIVAAGRAQGEAPAARLEAARLAREPAAVRRAARRLGLLVSRRRVASRGPRRAGGAPRSAGRRARGPQRRLRRAALLQGGERGGPEGARGSGGDLASQGRPRSAATRAPSFTARSASKLGIPRSARDDWRGGKPATRLTLLVENRAGYRNLCRLITAGALGQAEGRDVGRRGTRSRRTRRDCTV